MLDLRREAGDSLGIILAGSWRMQDQLPPIVDVEHEVTGGAPVHHLAFDGRGVTSWDSGLVSFVLKIVQLCAARGIAVDQSGLPDGVNRLIRLATAVPERKTRTEVERLPWLARIGMGTLGVTETMGSFVGFIGEATLAFARFLRGKADFRWVDLIVIVRECGPNALPIVTLISFLVGLILAFMGAVQLRTFGAQIYVADLVAIASTREMGCLMTGIIMAGRTGAAFAAQLGTMRVNEEIDALVTMGIPPMDFLVLPRMLALILMMPLLTLYSDLMAILGGAFVGASMLGLGIIEYFDRTRAALDMTDFLLGLVKGSIFGVLVAISGCLRGMQSGRSAAAVGLSTTSAVVTAIVLIVVAEGIIAVLLNALGI
jgi:phospholipid/cholesterol/gamma-HCH transport system permease protein